MTAYATNTDVAKYLTDSAPDSDLIDAMLDAVSDLVDTTAGLNPGERLWIQNYTETFDTKKNRKRLFPSHRPVTEIVSAKKMSYGTELSDYGYAILACGNYMELQIGLETKPQSLKIVYKAGFFESSSIPSGLKELVAQAVAAQYKQNQQQNYQNIKSKTIGEYSVSFGGIDEELREVRALLDFVQTSYGDNVRIY